MTSTPLIQTLCNGLQCIFPSLKFECIPEDACVYPSIEVMPLDLTIEEGRKGYYVRDGADTIAKGPFNDYALCLHLAQAFERYRTGGTT